MSRSDEIRKRHFEADVAVKKELGGYLYPHSDIMVSMYYHTDKNTFAYKFTNETDNSGFTGWFDIDEFIESSIEWIVSTICRMFMAWVTE